MAKVLIIDVAECVGCYCCQIACKDEHVRNDWTPYAKPQPDTGQFWRKVTGMERGTIPKVKVTYIPTLCMHCDNAPCIPVCSIGAIKRRDDGIVLIDPEKCNGCKVCIDACPYGALYFNEELKIAQKCTMCAHLLDKGWKEPRCVDACQRYVTKFGEYEELKDLIRKAEVLHPEYETRPRVFYLNLPKPFIAGTVVDPEVREIVEGAKVTATDLTNGKVYTTTSDEFGDFWFKNLEWNHRYMVKVEKEGYYTKTINVGNVYLVYTEKDVNLGNVYLYKKPKS